MAQWWQDEGFVHNGDVRLHYVAAGPPDGEPVLLIHGFPQFSYEWRYHLPALAAHGYRVVAPDLRGYHLSDRPNGVEHYRMKNLVSDIGAFYNAFGWQSANIVAHDWGGAISWLFVSFYPQMVKRFVVLDIPHPSAFQAGLRHIEQIHKSWYIWFFQFSEIPERIIGQDLGSFLRFMMVDSARPGTFSPADFQAYLENLSLPGAFEAAINYYRNGSNPATIYAENPANFAPLQMPVLLIYGKQDFAFEEEVWTETARYCSGYFRSVGLEGVGHWTPEEAPEETLKLILEHFMVK
ncbi:MAG TPA: alpha/beta hydrolase [Chloroflexia bacterium]|nr:alpha/beta hydrolase [Chloroflexia bacterium]